MAFRQDVTMSVSLLISQALNGLVLGAILALVASGLTIILGMLGLVNFAHGALFTLGAYVGYLTYEATGSFGLALLVATVLLGIFGMVLERGLLRRFYQLGHEEHILITLGIAMIVVELLRAYFGGISLRMVPPAWGTGALNLGFVFYPKYRLAVFAIAVLALLSLYLLLYRTRIGLVIRAGIEDALMARMLGVDVPRAFTLVFGIGVAAAGFAGVLYAPISSVSPDMGQNTLVQAFVVVVLGGLGSFAGAIVGGLLCGEVISLVAMVAPAYSKVALFAVMGLVLVTRPRGLFGKEGLG